MTLSSEHGKRASGGNDEPSAIPVVMGVTTPEAQAVPIYTSAAPTPATRPVEVVGVAAPEAQAVPIYTPAAPMPAARSVEVVAPAALAGGYQFHVDAAEANQTLLVEVVRKRVWECVRVYGISAKLALEYSVGLGGCACMHVCAFREKKVFVLCILARDTY
jgi:hypothetical protein